MLKRFAYSQKIATYVFVLPFVLVFAVFWVYPMFSSIGMSFQKTMLGQEAQFIGTANYERLAADGIFLKAVTNSVVYMLLTLVILIPFPLLIAVWINHRLMIGREFFKSALFFPALTSVVVAGTIFRLMFGEMETSLVNTLLGWFGIEPVKFLKGQVTGFIALLSLAAWRWTGVNMLYFLAGLKNIPDEYYEAAEIDGASSWQKLIRITLPLLKPITIYVITISIYGGLAMFIESMMLWNGNNSPKNIGLTIVGYLYRQGIERNDLGYAAAVGIVLLAIAMIINLTQLTWSGMFRRGGLKDA
ncbi:L-arabinose transport system permease protein AraP [Insulibacter thermoxylanivorax]|uniref:L-arabinose transport system permease protein AraP n=1 Tax=Insulibacter thermoxylanivorax TaxID=2749268 RepID=A0A916VEL3_9BACL|nr:sugar ABC transporter permease [Insulibacter thermoxylanivorax]GFR36739.1 L-arabinose transport system permease protein AraP [Insulibacter thermoxylanivorax]